MENKPSSLQKEPRPIQSVTGPLNYKSLKITDAHNHVWIDPVLGADLSAPVLNEYESILKELRSYRSAGGQSLLDCQPGGSGRNGNKLAELSVASGVNIIACTGFHRRKYASPDHWLFKASEEKIADYFISEIVETLEECADSEKRVRAGFIKIALEATWKDTPQPAMEAAAAAAFETGTLIEIHTEKGMLAEKAIIFFEDRHIPATQLVLCHMDKRPDFGLHSELAKYGVLLEYDTFYRPKYQPEKGVWPLISQMVTSGLEKRIALATDMAEKEMYTAIGGGPGLASLPGELRARLARSNMSDEIILGLLGDNIAARLAGLN